MGTTGCHLPCFVPEDTTKLQVLFYHAVPPNQQRIRQDTPLFAVRTVMRQQQVDLVAGGFDGAAWRRQSGSGSRSISSIEGAFVNTNLPLPRGSIPLSGPGGVPGECSDVCGFLKPSGSENDWQVRTHGAFTILYSTLGPKEKDQSCHHEVWIHLLHVNARLVDRVSREDKHRRPISRNRNSPQRKKAEPSARDHSREMENVIRMTSHASISAVPAFSLTPRLFRQGVR